MHVLMIVIICSSLSLNLFLSFVHIHTYIHTYIYICRYNIYLYICKYVDLHILLAAQPIEGIRTDATRSSTPVL